MDEIMDEIYKFANALQTDIDDDDKIKFGTLNGSTHSRELGKDKTTVESNVTGVKVLCENNDIADGLFNLWFNLNADGVAPLFFE